MSKNTTNTDPIPQLQTIEQALTILGQRIASEPFAQFIRSQMESDVVELRYELNVKHASNGYSVQLLFKPYAPKKSCGMFIRLK